MNNFDKLQQLDSQKIFDVIDSQPGQLRQEYAQSMRQDLTAKDAEGINNVIFAGMGGSGLAGSIVKNWLFERLAVPFEGVRGSTLPAYAGKNTLAIISSYSGNTTETLAAYDDAHEKNCKIVCITNGGKLLEKARQDDAMVLELPSVTQPRLAVFASLKALACILEDLEVVVSGDLRSELEDAASYLDTIKMAWSPDIAQDNMAMQIALDLHDKEVVIYSSPNLGSASYKWKIDINENAKQIAHSNVFSELNHNEMQGWLFPERKNIASIVLASGSDSTDIKNRITVTQEVLAQYGFVPRVITAQGSSQIQQILYTILLGDFVSGYLAILNGVDPTPVDLVEEFKKKLV